MNDFAISVLAALGAVLSSFPAAAQTEVERTIVYIECTKELKTSRGTGVVVSKNGHVLTAKHVVPNGASCKGSIGVADPNAMRMLVVQSTLSHVDAAILRIAGADNNHKFTTYCALEDWMVRKQIFAAGFPGGTQTGAASFRLGVLSTVFPNPHGVIETDSQTISGMSGGPVFTKDLSTLVGIVIGADFSANGTVSYYGILPISSMANLPGFDLTKRGQPCYRKSREVVLPADAGEWHADKEPLPLGVRADEGVCFLSKVRGQFNDPHDSVGIEVVNGEYVLRGTNKSGGEHGASARCFWFE